jgi:hypothetical protein
MIKSSFDAAVITQCFKYISAINLARACMLNNENAEIPSKGKK